MLRGQSSATAAATAAANAADILSEEEQEKLVADLRAQNARSARLFTRFFSALLVVLAVVYLSVAWARLVYEQAELTDALASGRAPTSSVAVVTSCGVAAAAFLASVARLALPLSAARWPTWAAVVPALGLAGYWGVYHASLDDDLGAYKYLPFVPLPVVAFALYSLYEASSTARAIDDLAGLMYKTKQS